MNQQSQSNDDNLLSSGNIIDFTTPNKTNPNLNPNLNPNSNPNTNPNTFFNPKIKLLSNQKLEILVVPNYKEKLQQQQEHMHQPEYTTANQYNFFLTKKQYEQLCKKEEIKEESIYEWFIQILSDELYKLSFYDIKFPKMKMFWPSQYSNRLNPKGDVQFYFNQFQDVQIEDYFDFIFFTKLENGQLILESYIAPQMMNNKKNNNAHYFEPLKQFIHQEETFQFQSYIHICEFVNNFVKKYLSKRNFDLTYQSLIERFQAIAKEKTRNLLYELYVKKD